MNRHFLLNPIWTEIAPNGLPRIPFADQSERMRYFEVCLQPWMVPGWVCKCSPFMINAHWLYQSYQHPDPQDEGLRQALCRILKDRFLQLIDATYIYMIDQSPGTLTPVFDQGKADVRDNPSFDNIEDC
jgi:hypothetical protein